MTRRDIIDGIDTESGERNGIQRRFAAVRERVRAAKAFVRALLATEGGT